MVLRLVRRWLIALTCLGLIAGAYVASPFLAAWSLREAIKSKDRATVERKVVWESVRTTLRASLATHAQLLPTATAAGAAVTPTLWQRIKSTFGGSMLDRFIETYVTPDGLSELFSYGKAWKHNIHGQPDEALRPWYERAQDTFARVRRAEFTSFTRIEIEVLDRNVSDRAYLSTFELIGLEWKLTELGVVAAAEGGRGQRIRMIDVLKASARPATSLAPLIHR